MVHGTVHTRTDSAQQSGLVHKERFGVDEVVKSR
jgi:hypothetical protein